MKHVILGLGPTETEIMETLWAQRPLTVRQVHTAIQKRRKIAYTTILTVSSHMEEKGLITRHATSDGYNSALLLHRPLRAWSCSHTLYRLSVRT